MSTDGIYANINTIEGVRLACSKFTCTVGKHLPEIEREIRIVQDGLDELRLQLIKKIELLQTEIDAASRDEDHSHLSNLLEAAEGKLLAVQQAIPRLEIVYANYCGYAQAIDALTTGNDRLIREFLTGSIERLIAYAAHNTLPTPATTTGTVTKGEPKQGDVSSRGSKSPQEQNVAPTDLATPTIGGRIPNNSRYAGRIHPSGIRYSWIGFPDFRPHAAAEIIVPGLTGNRTKDEAMANRILGLYCKPEGFEWHHVEDGKTMQLVPEDIHKAARHTGGVAIIHNGGFDSK